MQRTAPPSKTSVQLAAAQRLISLAEELLPVFQDVGFMDAARAVVVKAELARLRALIGRAGPYSRAEQDRMLRQLDVVNDLITLCRERLTLAQAAAFARARSIYLGVVVPRDCVQELRAAGR
jgi:signal transduction histidine kinase